MKWITSMHGCNVDLCMRSRARVFVDKGKRDRAGSGIWRHESCGFCEAFLTNKISCHEQDLRNYGSQAIRGLALESGGDKDSFLPLETMYGPIA